MEEYLHKNETYRIIGAAFEVYNEKGCGFLENVYQECMELELGIQSIPFTARNPLKLEYKGHALKQTYVPDLIAFGKVVIELKAVSALVDEHRSQLLNYLNATGLEVGLLLNFGHHKGLQQERFANTRDKKRHHSDLPPKSLYL